MNEKKEIKFYVAECMEFTSLGKLIIDIPTLEIAINLYNSIPSERLNGGKGIGFTLYKNGKFDSSFDLVNYGTVDVDLINMILDYKSNYLVQKAIEKALKYFKKAE